MKKNSKDEEKIKGLQVQWLFIIIGMLFAIFAGLTVNDLYELLRVHWSALFICIVFAILTVSFLDVFSYIFEHLEELKDDPDDSPRRLIYKYLRYRWHSIKNLLKSCIS